MTIFHLFQKLDRTMRNRPDAHRWRVTMNESEVEIFRRPVLTSEVTLGALGIGNAPMPVPVCVCKAVVINEHNLVNIVGNNEEPVITTHLYSAAYHMLKLIDNYHE